jgi:anti-sigma factor RsiW
MECREFDELASLDLSGELEPDRRAEYDQHLEGCGACAARLALQRRADELLRSSLSAYPVATAALVARVRERMHARPWWRRIAEMQRFGPLPVYAVAAVALLLAIGLHPTARSDSRVHLLDTAAADHREDLVERIDKPGWAMGDREVEPMAVRWVGDAGLAGALASQGYTLVKAKPCPLEGKSEPWLHLVYAREGRQISLFVRNSEIVSPSRGQRTLTAEPACLRVRDLEVVGRQRGRYAIVLVGDVSRTEALRLADAAADGIAARSI